VLLVLQGLDASGPICPATAGAVSLAWGHLIEHGGGLTDAMVFGRIAGAEAASLAATTPGSGA